MPQQGLAVGEGSLAGAQGGGRRQEDSAGGLCTRQGALMLCRQLRRVRMRVIPVSPVSLLIVQLWLDFVHHESPVAGEEKMAHL